MSEWHYVEGTKTVRPLDLKEIQAVLSKSSDPRNLLVWKAEFKSWMRAEDVPQLAELIFTPPPVPQSVPMARAPYEQTVTKFAAPKLLHAYFDFAGRLNRGQYVAILATSYVPSLAIIFSTEAAVHRAGTIAELGALVLFIVLFWVLFAATAKRFHDIGKTGLASLLLLVPVVGA
jgi:hypothetical protein